MKFDFLGYLACKNTITNTQISNNKILFIHNVILIFVSTARTI